MEALADTGATCLITTELRRPGFERNLDYEEYLAHGVILLQQLQVGKSLLRVIEIEKMRKTPVDNHPGPHGITDPVVEVFPGASVLSLCSLLTRGLFGPWLGPFSSGRTASR